MFLRRWDAGQRHCRQSPSQNADSLWQFTLGEAEFGGCAAALPQVCAASSSGDVVRPWRPGVAGRGSTRGAPAPQEGARPPLRGPTARPAVWADDVAGVVPDRRTRAQGV